MNNLTYKLEFKSKLKGCEGNCSSVTSVHKVNDSGNNIWINLSSSNNV